MSASTTVPLTTIFTPPASCSTAFTFEGSYYNAIPSGLLIQNAVADYQNTACFPSGFTQYGRAVHNSFVYSPGACPVGYSTAAAFPGETTTAVCCQS